MIPLDINRKRQNVDLPVHAEASSRGPVKASGKFEIQSLQPYVTETPMNGRRLAAGLLVVAFFALWPFAYASPIDPIWIDPIWIDGFWDDGHHDDVVILVTSMGLLLVLVAASVATLKPQSLRGRAPSPIASRAPPAHA
jgi:hypothetical protein